MKTVAPCKHHEGPRAPGRRCAECHRLENAARYAAQPETWAPYHAKRMVEHRAEMLASKKAWKAANAEYVREYNRVYNEAFRTANPGYQAGWRKRNPESVRASASRYRASKNAALGSHTDQEWRVIVDSQRSRCNNCGLVCESLERDHIVPISLGGSDYAVNIQGLCRSCNASKSNSLATGTQLGVFDRLVEGVK